MRKEIKRNHQTIDFSSLIPTMKKVIIAVASAAGGFALNWVLDGDIILGAVSLGVLAVLCSLCWIIACVYEDKDSIISILNKNIRDGKYSEAVKWGLSVSRALFLAGKYRERCKMSEKVLIALEHLHGEIVINEQSMDVLLVQASVKIDEFGWSFYMCDRFANREYAQKRIIDGLEDCIRVYHAESRKAEIFNIMFQGLRHLYAMAIENFDELSQDYFADNRDELEKYRNDILQYGGLLGYLIGNTDMADIHAHEEYYSFFKSLVHVVERECFDELRTHMTMRFSTNNTFKLNSSNFITKYFLGLAKLEKYSDKPQDDIIKRYLDEAKNIALGMSIGYAPSLDKINWMRTTIAFSQVTEYIEGAIRKPDSERFVKTYVLLGNIATEYSDLALLKDAHNAYENGAEESKHVNRTDTYIKCQRRIISVNEKMFKAKLQKDERGYYINPQEALEELEELTKKMDRVLLVTKKYLGFRDIKTIENCRERRKKYHQLEKKLKNQIKKQNKEK